MKHLTPASHSRRSSRGFSLLEVMLALALFATAAVVLVETMNEIGNITIQARNLRQVEQGIESLLDEYSKIPQMMELEKDLKAGKDGIGYKISVRPLENVKNQTGEILTGLFQITVTALWQEDGRPMTIQADTVRYAGMFRPK